MARTKRRKSVGIQPAQRSLFYVISPSSGAFDVIIDVAKDLSAVNRRLYRQGMQYYIQDCSIATGKGTVVSVVATAGDTWMVHNAWKKGYALWRDQQKQLSAPADGGAGDHGRHYHGKGMAIAGKWADFKVELWDGGGTPLTSIAGGDAATPDEWNLSNFVWDDDGVDHYPTFCLIGATAVASKIGMIQEYHISRQQVSTQPVGVGEASDSIFSKSLVNDEAMNQLIDIVEDENDNPPYDANEMPGGDTQADEPLVQSIQFANEQGASHTGGFTAECGLIRVSGTSQLTTTFPHATAGDNNYDDIHYLSENLNDQLILEVKVAPGPYRGVMASRMGQ